MRSILTISATLLAMATPMHAEGEADPAKGAKEFRKCKACHAITAPDGTAILKGGRTGPDLYGVIGRIAGSTDFKYSSIMQAAGATGLIWDLEGFAAYIADPNSFLSEAAGESGRSKMTKQRVKSPADIVAYLESVVE